MLVAGHVEVSANFSVSTHLAANECFNGIKLGLIGLIFSGRLGSLKLQFTYLKIIIIIIHLHLSVASPCEQMWFYEYFLSIVLVI